MMIPAANRPKPRTPPTITPIRIPVLFFFLEGGGTFSTTVMVADWREVSERFGGVATETVVDGLAGETVDESGMSTGLLPRKTGRQFNTNAR